MRPDRGRNGDQDGDGGVMTIVDTQMVVRLPRGSAQRIADRKRLARLVADARKEIARN